MKGFPFKFKNIENIVNHIFELKNVKYIGKFWVYRFIKYQIELKIRFNCIYDFQKAFYKDFKFIEK